MTATLQQIARAIPAPAEARDRKPPIEKLRKYGAKEFKAVKDEDSSVAEY